MITNSGQFTVIIYSILFGAIVGFVYDAMGIFRNIFFFREFKENKKAVKSPTYNELSGKGKTFTTVFDVLFCILTIPFLAIFLFIVNNGVVRWYIVVACMLGIVFYHFSIGRPIRYVFVNFSYRIGKLLHKISNQLIIKIKSLKKRKAN